MAAGLEIRDLDVDYGAIHAVKGLSLRVEEGEIVALVGANGAGKSSTLRAISGETPAARGTIRFGAESLLGRPAHEIARKGVIQCPEGRRIFASLSVQENLDLGAYGVAAPNPAASLERVFALFPRLLERRTQLAGTLSGGEQQMLAIGRALMARPRVLLLDEPSLGLAPILVETVFRAIEEINRGGTSVLLVEQNAFMALQIARHGYVLETGRVVLAGPTDQLLRDQQILRAYLG